MEIPQVPVKSPRRKHMAATDVDDVSVNVESTVNEAVTPNEEGITNVQHTGETVEENSANDRQGCTCSNHGSDWDKKEATLKEQLNLQFSHTFVRACQNKNRIRKIPVKMLMFIINIIFVTWQLILFANERSQFAAFLNQNNIALKHLLLKDWSRDYETMPYPPTTGTYGVYKITELEDHVQYVVEGIHSLPTTAVASFFLNTHNGTAPIRICATYFESGTFNRTTNPPVVTIHRQRKTQCNNVETNTENYGLDPSLKDLIKSENGVLVRLLELTIDFSISSIHVNMRREERPPECFEILGRVTFDNYEINGQIPVILTTSINGFECEGDSASDANAIHVVLFVIVLIINGCCILGSVLSFKHSFVLWLEVRHFFNERWRKDNKKYEPLSSRGCWEILKFRDVLVIISCIVTIIGSCMKISYDMGNLTTNEGLDVCGIMLGIGCLLLWMLSLHYLAFSKVFKLLFLVLDRSSPSIIRFLLCIFVMYIGFALCGWAVLGPHHIKFLSFSATFQNLLALMNGDEVYVTMTAVDEERQIAAWFNSIFVTFFIFLFTIITLNVFIAIYNTTYEDIVNDNRRSDLMEFVAEAKDNKTREEKCKCNCLAFDLNCKKCTQTDTG